MYNSTRLRYRTFPAGAVVNPRWTEHWWICNKDRTASARVVARHPEYRAPECNTSPFDQCPPLHDNLCRNIDRVPTHEKKCNTYEREVRKVCCHTKTAGNGRPLWQQSRASVSCLAWRIQHFRVRPMSSTARQLVPSYWPCTYRTVYLVRRAECVP